VQGAGAVEGWRGEVFTALELDAGGTLWVGSYFDGVFALRDGKLLPLPSEVHLPGNQVRALRFARNGVLWIGTSAGVVRWDPAQQRVLPPIEGLPQPTIMAIHEDRAGRVWLGGSSGLIRVEGERFVRIGEAGKAPGEAYFGFSEDADGTLWIASDAGLVRSRGEQLSILGRPQGLPFYSVLALARDEAGDFWLGSDNGVLRVSDEEVNAVLDGARARIGGRLYGREDGMPSRQVNGGTGSPAIRAANGELWFSTARGIAIIDPEGAAGSLPPPPPVSIERLVVDDREADARLGLDLEPGRHSIVVQFASTALARQGQLEHFYRLGGYDEQWRSLGAERTLRLTDLPPGRYALQIAARFGEGALSLEPASLDIAIRPFVWQRRWFVPLLALLVLTLGAGIVLWRTRALRVRSAQLAGLVAEKTAALEHEMSRLAASDAEKARLLQLLGAKSAELERLAREDPLTGLFNRRHLDQRLREAFAGDGQCAVLLLDIDHFKAVNDTFTHQVGDEVLRRFSVLLREAFPDAAIGRWGGEEFAILLPGADAALARQRAEALRARVVADTWSTIAPTLAVTVSIGVAARDGEAQYGKVVARADARLYEAKRGGRNRVV
jgi:diguanylate cyclase (GGDEF)-like protein